MRPHEQEHTQALAEFDAALTAVRESPADPARRAALVQKQRELHATAKRFYSANPDLPIPEGATEPTMDGLPLEEVARRLGFDPSVSDETKATIAVLDRL